MVRSWCDRVHSRYGVDLIPQSHSQWFLCTLHTVQWDLFGGFYVSFVHSTDYSARLFLQLSELGPPIPSTAGECVPSIPLGVSSPSYCTWGGGTLACVWRGSLYGVDVTAWSDLAESKKSEWSDFDQSKWLVRLAASNGFLLILWWRPFIGTQD
jgi:hypothetical protein